MRWAGLCIALAACGGGNGNSGGDGGSAIDGPPPSTPLDQRLTVKDITTPAGVKAGDSNYRIWGSRSLRIAPVYVAPLADCGTLVGYTTGSSPPTARVAHLDINDALVETFDLGAFVLRGIAAEPDGNWGALLWDDPNDELFVKRYSSTGSELWSASLDDALAVPTDFNIGETRLAFGGGKYGAYYHVHGISGFANGHEGDQLKWVTTAGAVSTQWQWGCSHSMSELLRHDGTDFLSACVTDCYPGTTGSTFSTSSIGGIYLDHDAHKVMNVDGGCNGSVAGELGSLTPAASGWKLVFNAHQAPATMGQSSYSSTTMNQDVGFTSIDASGAPASVVWLTSTASVDEANGSIARWQPAGDATEQYVVGWTETGTTPTYKLARVSATGDVVDSFDITAKAKWGERDDPFRVQENKDVVWAWFDMAGATTLHVARLGAGNGRPPNCSTL